MTAVAHEVRRGTVRNIATGATYAPPAYCSFLRRQFAQVLAQFDGVGRRGVKLPVGLIFLPGMGFIAGGLESHGEIVMSNGLGRLKAQSLLVLLDGGFELPRLEQAVGKVNPGHGVFGTQPQVFTVIADGVGDLARMPKGIRQGQPRLRVIGLVAQGFL